MYEKNIDHEIVKLIEKKYEISYKEIAFNLSVPEELIKMRIANFNDTREKILIMSHGFSVYDSLKAVLEPENYSVVKAPLGSSALETVKSEKPDLVLLDNALSDIDGFEICIQLKASSRYRWMPIVILGETGEAKDRVRAFESEADDYVTTPFNPLELKARVSMILRRARM